MTTEDQKHLDEIFTQEEQQTLSALLHKRFHDDARLWMKLVVKKQEFSEVAAAIINDKLFEEMANELELRLVTRAIEMPEYQFVSDVSFDVYKEYRTFSDDFSDIKEAAGYANGINMMHRDIVKKLSPNGKSVTIRYLTTEDIDCGDLDLFLQRYQAAADTPLDLDPKGIIENISDYYGYYIGAFLPDRRTMVGICSLGGPEGVVPEADHNDVVLSDLYVLPEYRHMKIGSALVCGAAEIALKEHGKRCSMYLMPLTRDHGYGFYNKLGFRFDGGGDGMSCGVSYVVKYAPVKTVEKEDEER